MKNDSSPPASSTSTSTSTRSLSKKDRPLSASLFGISGYKFWVLSAILLLAFWSMFTGSVSLKWSSGNLTRFPDDVDFSIHHDLDILEVEERKKMVRRMWDVYTHGTNVRLPRFWSEAFEAAYEYLTSDVPGLRDFAVSEIAKMSLRSLNLDPLPVLNPRLVVASFMFLVFVLLS
ncbi:hypothetical protein Pint_08936 [Pistacia integerrima]|uniref:Uncharacterized protein n=1 Tax=Pistacia integerrima TaxID=434235 RepID=A0ACC0XW93_9ROSI|nr:hypothetical protein Pint_08936 [Pistacia integerrima]